MSSSLIELRVLDGPNLYFPRAAIKLTFDLSALSEADAEVVNLLARRIGLRNVRPGEPGSGFRQRFAARAVARLVRHVAAESGTGRLAVRVRPTHDPHHLVVAYPWRRRDKAVALGHAVADVLDSLLDTDVTELLAQAADRVRAAEAGEAPTTLRPSVPVIAVTGTNGKTTTSRLIAHIARTHGLHVGWSSTDGIYVDGVLVEAGDYSGPSGAGRVLAHPEVELAVTETARGGILLRGIGLVHNDVSVVTNVSADHLGLHGIDTLDQLAEVKSVVARITRTTGWSVLNADDPRVLSMRPAIKAQHWMFSRDADSPALREAVSSGGRATSVIDGWLCVLRPGTDPEPLVEVAEIPMTLAGLSRFNVENALAAASAALAVGLPRAVVAQGLRSFRPGPEHNPGRMNIYSVGEVSVVLDLAHNEAGLEALLEIMTGLRRPGGRLLLALGTAGDRTDDVLRSLGEIAAREADVVAVVHKLDYLRGREPEQVADLFAEGAAHVGLDTLATYPCELDGLVALFADAGPGDVVGVMCHQDRPALEEWVREQGGTVDSPETLTRKVRIATG